jgi:hypothetical protein
MKILLSNVLLLLPLALPSSIHAPTPAQPHDAELHKRQTPTFAVGWIGARIVQIKQGFDDACHLAQVARDAVRRLWSGRSISLMVPGHLGPWSLQPLLSGQGGRNRKVFDSIIGDENGLCGNINLSQISIMPHAPPGKTCSLCTSNRVCGTRGLGHL